MIRIKGHDYGTAHEIAAQLGADITPARIRDWARRDLIQSYRARGHTWHRLDQAADVERRTRTSTRGQKRRSA